MTKLTKILLMTLFYLMLTGTAYSQSGKGKLGCQDSVKILTKLYEKTIVIAQEYKANSDIKSQIITNQTEFIKVTQDTLAHIKYDNLVLSQENSALKQKVKTRNLQLIVVGILVVLQTFLIATQ